MRIKPHLWREFFYVQKYNIRKKNIILEKSNKQTKQANQKHWIKKEEIKKKWTKHRKTSLISKTKLWASCFLFVKFRMKDFVCLFEIESKFCYFENTSDDLSWFWIYNSRRRASCFHIPNSNFFFVHGCDISWLREIGIGKWKYTPS